MITYDPLWLTMKQRKISKYYLKTYCNVNNGTLHRLKHNKPLNTVTIDSLCEILDCQVQDIMQYKKNKDT